MIIIKGKHNKARIHTDIVEENVAEQIQTMCDLEELENSKIEIMPDCHSGKGCVIGTTIVQDITDPINPSYVGVDIGCGVSAIEVSISDNDFNEEKLFEILDNAIIKSIPYGTNVRNINVVEEKYFNQLRCLENLDEKVIDRAKKSLGTLGSGNHFIEVDKMNNGNYLVVVHSGSRNLGKKVAEYYMSIANENGFLVNRLDILDYLIDSRICQMFAKHNRELMLDVLYLHLMNNFESVKVEKSYSSIHNFVEVLDIENDNVIIRKGAIPSYENEILLIPINMRDGMIIGKGKSNKNINYSAPHGAGRLMGRGQAKRELSLEEFKNQMEGIHSICVSENTLDEAPNAYKPIEAIIDNISDMVDIIEIVKPIYNFKA